MRQRLGHVQLRFLALLKGCGEMSNPNSYAERVLESLVRKSLVMKTTDEFGRTTYTLFQPL
jgi:hypothetical protein